MARSVDVRIVAAFALAVATPAQGAERQQIDLAPGRLGEVVVALGRQTGSSIGMSDPSLAALATPALRGRMGVDAALAHLLKGSGARARRVGTQSWRVVRAKGRPPPPRPVLVHAPPPRPPAAELIVTASKRNVPLLRYAGVAEAVDASLLPAGDASLGTATLTQRVASLSSTHIGAGRNKLFVRAIADSGVAGPTQATTGQYLGDMRLNYAQPDPDLRLYDMRGVEVLEGPQGTLYGAGSLGGIVRLIPNPPDMARMGAQLSAGLSATRHGDRGGDLSATVNLPIIADRLALRIVGYGVNEGGYVDNLVPAPDGERRLHEDVNDVRVNGGRAALRFTPDETWTIDLNGVHQAIRGDDAQYVSRLEPPLTRASAVTQPYASDYSLANVRVERQWGALRFVSSTGHVHHILSESYDATPRGGDPALFRQRNAVDIFSTENRLVRDLDNGLGWIVGVSYLDSRSRIRRSLTSFGPASAQGEIIPGVPMYGRGQPAQATGVRNRIREGTLFGEASFEPWTGIIATLGGRLTNSRLSGAAVDPTGALPATEIAAARIRADRSETIFLPSLSLLADMGPGTAVYVRFQQGFRPGGLAADDKRIIRYRNDRVSTVEAGLRSGVPGRDAIALSANIAYTNWKDIQADVTDRIGLPSTANIGDGRIYTLEGRVVLRPIARLALDGAIIYNGSRLTRPAAFVRVLASEDNSLRLPNVANLGGRLAVDYRAPLGRGMGLHLSGSARYVGGSRIGVGPILGEQQGDYVETAMSATLSRGPVALTIGVINLLDDRGNRFALGTPFDLSADYYTPIRPRTVRIGLDFVF
ncbi:MAG: TonB-dependent receptor [Sphingobium sp.]